MTTSLFQLMLFSLVLSAGPPGEAAEVQSRLDHLEVQAAALRAEIQAYRQEVQRLPPVVVQSESRPAALPVTMELMDAPSAKASPADFTEEALKGVLQKLAWTKGPFTFTPYGRLWTSVSYDTQRTQIGDYVLWIDSPDLRQGSEFQVDARSTRLGIDVAGPAIACLDDAKVGGKVEIDFQGVSILQNKGNALFRHGYVEVKNDDYRLVAGQTWDVISPLYTPTFDYTVGRVRAIWLTGAAQFRVERYLPRSDTFMITLQTAAAVDILVGVASADPIRGNHSGWPDWQNRVAFTFGERKAKGAEPIEIGVSGHVGEQNYDFFPGGRPPVLGFARPTWSFNVDAKIPITKTFGVQGELFTGANLSNYFGGIMQGIDPGTLNVIRDNGAWGDIWYDMRPDLHWNLGYSLDDPVNADMTTGRTYNQYFYCNFIYDITKFLNAGLEVSSWKTFYFNQRPGEAMRLEAMARYNF